MDTAERDATQLIAAADRAFFPVYSRFPIVIERAEGCMLYDSEGNEYLDFISGIGVNALGGAHPRVLEAIQQQSQRYLHLSNLFYQAPQIELATQLLMLTRMKRVFFTNSGSEAIEAAIKLARRWGAQYGKSEIVGFSGGFHGRTYGPLSIMHQPRYREQMGPFLSETLVLPFNDVETLRLMITKQTAAVVLEVIQGAGGIREVQPQFAETLAALHQQFGFLLIVDEVQTGFGRTGQWFAVQQTPLRPDIIVIGKAVGGGLPLGAMLGNERVANVWDVGHHGSTFGGNALACAAGLVVIEQLQQGLLRHVQEVSSYFEEHLQQLAQRYTHHIAEVRGKGLMRGIVLRQSAAPLAQAAMNDGLLINATAGNVLRLLPPLIVTPQQIDAAMSILDRLLQRLRKEPN